MKIPETLTVKEGEQTFTEYLKERINLLNENYLYDIDICYIDTPGCFIGEINFKKLNESKNKAEPVDRVILINTNENKPYELASTHNGEKENKLYIFGRYSKIGNAFKHLENKKQPVEIWD
jgi:hypothetical protein